MGTGNVVSLQVSERRFVFNKIELCTYVHIIQAVVFIALAVIFVGKNLYPKNKRHFLFLGFILGFMFFRYTILQPTCTFDLKKIILLNLVIPHNISYHDPVRHVLEFLHYSPWLISRNAMHIYCCLGIKSVVWTGWRCRN